MNKVLLAFIATIIILESYHSLFFPIYAFDGIVTDSYSKWTYYSEGYPNPGLAWMNPLSFNMTWLYIVLGQINELVSHFVHMIYLYILMYYTYRLSDRLGGNGVLACFLVTTFPLFALMSNSSYMEIPFAALIVICFFYLLEVVDGRTLFVPLLGFLNGALIIAKPHGLYFLMLPFVYLLFSQRRGTPLTAAFRNFVSLTAMIILVATPIYLANNLLIPNYYSNLFINQPGRPELWRLSVGDHIHRIGQQYGILAKPIMGLLALLSLEPIASSAVCFVLFAFSLRYLFKRRRITRDVDLLYLIGLPYFLIYLFMLSYESRYSLHWLPLLAVIASVNITAFLGQHKRKRGRLAALLLVLLLPAMHYSLELAVWGRTVGWVGGPNLTWAVTHPFIPLEEKKEVLLGDMYKTARFVNDGREFKGATIGIIDARQLNYIFNATTRFVSVSSVYELTDLDYVILPTSWSKTFLGLEVSAGLQEEGKKGVTQTVFSSGDFHVLKINRKLLDLKDIHYGKTGARPVTLPFCLMDRIDASKNIWIEAEEFSIIANGNDLPALDPSVVNSSEGAVVLFRPNDGNDVSDAIHTAVTVLDAEKYRICVRFYTSDHISDEDTGFRIVIDNNEYPLISAGSWRWNEQCIDIGTLQQGDYSLKIVQTLQTRNPWFWIDAVLLSLNPTADVASNPMSVKRIDTAWGRPELTDESPSINIWQDEEGWHIDFEGLAARIALEGTDLTVLNQVNTTSWNVQHDQQAINITKSDASGHGELSFKSDDGVICVTDFKIIRQS